MAQPKLAIIAALSHNHVIGQNGDIPWHLPTDQAFFKETTLHHAIIMGSKTFWSLPEKVRPFPKRTSVVISRTAQESTDNLFWVKSPDEALTKARAHALAHQQDVVFVGGGGEIYNHYLPQVARMYLTHIHADYDGNAFFPSTYLTMQWHKELIADHLATETQPGFTIVQYDRI